MSSIRSAPTSRASSVKRAFSTHYEGRDAFTPPFTPIDSTARDSDVLRHSRSPSQPVAIDVTLAPMEDPIAYREFASTPLLPPMMDAAQATPRKDIQSPLQSPTIAPSGEGSFANTPVASPALQSMPTPPLSAKPSLTSFPRNGSGQSGLGPDIPPMPLSDDNDPWAAKLGHANFHITPEPYFPDHCDSAAFKRLTEDWEVARTDYLRQVARISENYGPTSQVYKYAEQKWAEIDAVWRANHDLVKVQSGVESNDLAYQPLPENTPASKMPSLNDPSQPLKFPKIDDSDIVGPMVQYARVQRPPPSKKPSLLRLFTDPASLLGRSAFSARR